MCDESTRRDALPRIARDHEYRRLTEALEDACDRASRLYDEGRHTAEADAEVDRLLALVEAARGDA